MRTQEVGTGNDQGQKDERVQFGVEYYHFLDLNEERANCVDPKNPPFRAMMSSTVCDWRRFLKTSKYWSL